MEVTQAARLPLIAEAVTSPTKAKMARFESWGLH